MRDFAARIIIALQYRRDIKQFERRMDIMTYNLMKRLISKGGYDKESTLAKLDVFLIADRITPEEYQELAELMGGDDRE